MLPENLKIIKLKEKHLDQILKLHKETFQHLQERGQGLWVLPKSKDDFLNFLTNHFMFGIIDSRNDKLIGQVVCYFPEAHEDFYDDYVDFGIIKKTQMFHIKTLELDENYWGDSLGVHLFEACSLAALDHGRRYSVSDVAFENWQSIRSFDKTGHVISHCIHPEDKVLVDGEWVDDIQLVIMVQDVKEPFVFDESVGERCAFDVDEFHHLVSATQNGMFPSVDKCYGSKEFVINDVPALASLLKLAKAA
tara:strand:- start:6791 stop:7537 length:747 start_codon:yes stop_codon:yes gene_type:complete